MPETPMALNSVPRLAPPLARRLVGIEDAAQYLGVSADTVLGMLARGALHRVALPGVRRLLLDVRELDAVVDAGRAG
jgi:excisionase family DNA binding protein